MRQSFKPQVDEYSRKLLEKKGKSGQNMSSSDASIAMVKQDRGLELIQKGKEYKEKREKLVKDKKEQADLEKCTFKPKLNTKYQSTKTQALNDRCKSLLSITFAHSVSRQEEARVDLFRALLEER